MKYYTVYNATSKQFFVLFFKQTTTAQLYYEDETKFMIKSITRVKNWMLQTAEKCPEPTNHVALFWFLIKVNANRSTSDKTIVT